MIRYSFTLKIPKKTYLSSGRFLVSGFGPVFFLFFWRLWTGLIRFLGCFRLKTS
jgi:hypothetical protein